MRKQLITCDRCGEPITIKDLVTLTHDAREEHPCDLAYRLSATIDLCTPCANAFGEWVKPTAAEDSADASDRYLAQPPEDEADRPAWTHSGDAEDLA